MAQPQEETKKSFYAPKIDDKFKILQRPIGVDVDTSRYTTRIIEPSSGISRTTLGSISHLAGKKIDFDFGVSPGMLIDWNKSCLECDMYFADGAGTSLPVETSSLIMWNQLLTMFSEIHLQLNGVNVFDKVGDDYAACQTLKWLVENSREELESSSAVFTPIFDEYYSTNVTTPSVVLQDRVTVVAGTSQTAGFLSVETGASMSYRRNTNWLPGLVTNRVKKSPTLKDLFFSIPGYCKNLKDVKLSFTLNSECQLARHSVLSSTNICYLYPYDFRIQLQEVQPSPNSSIINLQDKMSASDEHLAFIDVESRLLNYSESMVVNNQQNVQYICVTQFGGDFTNIYTNTASLDNKGQTQLFNGYSSNTVAAGTVLYRTDKMSSTKCLAPPSSIQVQYGSDMYPTNAINLRRSDTAQNLLATNELYREFLRTVNQESPSIREDEFNRTFPLFLIRTHPMPKLMQSADIVVRLPGFDKGSNTGTTNCRILWAKLKTFNIAPSNVVSEVISTY